MNKKDMLLKQKLEHHYRRFDRSSISPDPLQFLHLYRSEKDIEAAGLISAVFAYGNVAQIINTLEKLRLAADDKPYNFIINFNGEGAQRLAGIKHRFYTNDDITTLFAALKIIYKEYGMFKNLFLRYYNADDPNVGRAISGFSKEFYRIINNIKNEITPGLRFMFPVPEMGSACKRTNLFLRWMVRRDELDFGLWKEVDTSKLIIPVDTHVARVCRGLKLTARKNADWRMALEITENLKKFDSADPVKYDFAICHIGMRKLKF